MGANYGRLGGLSPPLNFTGGAVRDKKFGCRVTDYGNDDFEIVPCSDRRTHMKKMWTKCDIVSSGDKRVEGGHIRYSSPMLELMVWAICVSTDASGEKRLNILEFIYI